MQMTILITWNENLEEAVNNLEHYLNINGQINGTLK